MAGLDLNRGEDEPEQKAGGAKLKFGRMIETRQLAQPNQVAVFEKNQEQSLGASGVATEARPVRLIDTTRS
jgi:hypothetical protein